jgi:23S rRNA-/tRNA-specific pseudouridylate synthase
MPIMRDTEPKGESPDDPFGCGIVSRKSDISGEYVMTADQEQESVNFWLAMSEAKNIMDKDENLDIISSGTLRRDSDNQPRYHGQYSPSNTKVTLNDTAYQNVIMSRQKLLSTYSLEETEETATNYEPTEPKSQKQNEDILNVNDFFPNRKTLNIQKHKIGEFAFKCADDWFDGPLCVRPKTGKYNRLPHDATMSFGLREDGKPDVSVIEGLQFAQDSPLRSLDEIRDEIEAIKEETAADESDASDDEEQEDDVSAEEPDPDQSTSSTPGELTDKEKESMSAYDYVMKLRKGEVKPESEKLQQAFDAINVNALDSRGFNSYKGYAPDLTQFRRSELLWNLKKSILYCENDILAINKPYGLIVQGKERKEDTHAPVLTELLDEFSDLLLREKILSEQTRLRIVHRLDKEATGILLLAMSQEKAAFLQKCFEEKTIGKTYHAITRGVPDPYKGFIDIPIEEGHVDGKDRLVLRPEVREELQRTAHPRKHSKRALTEFKVIASKHNAALVEVKPITGVKHQIRVHLGFGMRTPVLGDPKYTYLDRIAPQKLPTDMLTSLNVRPSKVRNIPLHLFCRLVSIPGAGDEGKTIFIRAQPPAFFSKTMKKLGLHIDSYK